MPIEEFATSSLAESSATIRQRIERARSTQSTRQGCSNAVLGVRETEVHCVPCARGEALLRSAIVKLSLSARAYHRILRVARSVADLAASPTVAAPHVAEAIQYRRLDPAF